MRQGNDVLVAADGLTGVDMTSSATPDPILTDPGLPVMNGWEAARGIEADTEILEILLVALTAQAVYSCISYYIRRRGYFA